MEKREKVGKPVKICKHEQLLSCGITTIIFQNKKHPKISNIKPNWYRTSVKSVHRLNGCNI